jgi:hypothetical protein
LRRQHWSLLNARDCFGCPVRTFSRGCVNACNEYFHEVLSYGQCSCVCDFVCDLSALLECNEGRKDLRCDLLCGFDQVRTGRLR